VKAGLVAVVPWVIHANCFADLNIVQTGQAGKAVPNQRCFQSQLLGVVNMLKLAAAAGGKTGASRLTPPGRLLYDFQQPGAGVVPFYMRDLNQNRIPGHRAWDEHGHTAVPTHSLAGVGKPVYP